jgi:transcriptional regulator with XRE-family HTH domain
MRTPDQRGRYGRWLVAAREARGWDTAQKALDALAAAGIRIGKSTYAEYESGSKVPSRNHLPLLEGFWGRAPDGAADEPTMAAALSALADELRLSREARDAEEARLRSVEMGLAVLAQRLGVELPERSAPRVTTG